MTQPNRKLKAIFDTSIDYAGVQKRLKRHNLSETQIVRDCITIGDQYKKLADNLLTFIHNDGPSSDDSANTMLNKVIVAGRNANYWTWYAFIYPLFYEQPWGLDLIKDHDKLILSDNKVARSAGDLAMDIHRNAKRKRLVGFIDGSRYGLT